MSVNSEQRLAVQLVAAKRLIVQFETGAGRHNSNLSNRSASEGAGVQIVTARASFPEDWHSAVTLHSLRDFALQKYYEHYRDKLKLPEDCAVGDIADRKEFPDYLRNQASIVFRASRKAFLLDEDQAFSDDLRTFVLEHAQVEIKCSPNAEPVAVWFSHFKRIA